MKSPKCPLKRINTHARKWIVSHVRSECIGLEIQQKKHNNSLQYYQQQSPPLPMVLTLEIPSAFGYVLAVALAYTLELFVFGGVVGHMRKKHKVPYPDVTGAPEFNRAMRVHYNALEGTPFFFVGLILSGLYWPEVSALAGVVYMIGRAVYCVGYLQAPEKRSAGAYIFHLAELVLLVLSVMFIGRVIFQ
ncbi:hypothetical protein C9374_008337 [Naegleria lovaniensis]|uniref:MAPEG family protein n=1 Tax=Naegleria lovaniensis TaxID=51637 RepID=A0AA88KKU8_NAELO|nr:uncharacterized protein C9374_008337 [Naegleria lovaniensis]KAG2378194.1 hypothetical protein C9374_008337 [Naegleria lovaniensis]